MTAPSFRFKVSAHVNGREVLTEEIWAKKGELRTHAAKVRETTTDAAKMVVASLYDALVEAGVPEQPVQHTGGQE